MYPSVDLEKCTNCGICLKHCISKETNHNSSEPELYDAAMLNERIIKNSASGGISAALMMDFLKRREYVSGAVLDKDLNCRHIVTNSIHDLEKIQGSKYVQSSMKDVYSEIEKKVKDVLLFIGTPCQVAAIKQYFKVKKIQTKLYTVDILCHGVPSQQFFNKYINELKGKYQKRITSFRFRIKGKKYNRMTSSVIFADGSHIDKDQIHCDYLKMYYSASVYRKSCYTCKYAKFPRIGDLTIGDSFYSEKYSLHKEFNYKNGVSIVSVNNDKGKELFDLLSNCKKIREDKTILKYNENFFKSTPPNKRNPEIIVSEKSIHELNRIYNPLNLLNKLAYYSSPSIVKTVKKLIRRS